MRITSPPTASSKISLQGPLRVLHSRSRRLNLKKDAVPTIFHFEVKRKFGEEQVDLPKNKTAARGNPEERVRPAFAKRRRLEVKVLHLYQL